MPASVSTIITMALVFYSIGVWSERIQGRLKWWHLVFFWIGLVCDTVGTGMMFDYVGGMTFDIHGITGTIAIVLRADYERFSTQLGPQRMSRSGFTLADLNPELVLTPGPFEECGAAAVRAGAAEVRGPATGALPTERR